MGWFSEVRKRYAKSGILRCTRAERAHDQPSVGKRGTGVEYARSPKNPQFPRDYSRPPDEPSS